MESTQQQPEVWAVYSDGTEDGRRVRHVHSIVATPDEAKDVLRWYADLGVTLAMRRFDNEAEARAFEIDGEWDDSDPLDRLHAIREYEASVS